MKKNQVRLGMRVEAGRRGTEDHDTGEVLDIDPRGEPGHEVYVGWDSLSKSWCDANGLRETA